MKTSFPNRSSRIVHELTTTRDTAQAASVLPSLLQCYLPQRHRRKLLDGVWALLEKNRQGS